MLRDLLSNRTIQVASVFFVFVVGGTQLYYWHIRNANAMELARTEQAIQQLRTEAEIYTRQEAGVPTETETPRNATRAFRCWFGASETHVETDNTKMIPEEPAAFIDDAEISVSTDMLGELEETRETENEAGPYSVSPFGFGPLPEIPPDYPDQDIWDDIHASTGGEPYSELVIRTRIALWKQGIRTVGAVRDNTYNLIYPIIDDVAYIKWSDTLGPEGKPYVQRVLTSPTTDDSYDLHQGIFPPHLTVYEFPDGGIDPYTFLGLPRIGE